MIDRLFPDVYEYAHELGMAIDILTNGSRLANRRILDLLTARPANLVTVSVYGASAGSYDGLTRRSLPSTSSRRRPASPSEAATPDGPPSTSTRTAWRACARSAVNRTCPCSRKEWQD